MGTMRKIGSIVDPVIVFSTKSANTHITGKLFFMTFTFEVSIFQPSLMGVGGAAILGIMPNKYAISLQNTSGDELGDSNLRYDGTAGYGPYV